MGKRTIVLQSISYQTITELLSSDIDFNRKVNLKSGGISYCSAWFSAKSNVKEEQGHKEKYRMRK